MESSSDARILRIEAAIRSAGGRVTTSRVRVLDLLQSSQVPLSHGDVEELLSNDKFPGIDRVTIYRVLDWLADVGLAHKAADGRGVFRFSASNPDGKHAQHIHFRCTGCGGLFCLDSPLPQQPKLPRGFRFGGMALDICGECPRCAHSHS
jgi:Fur family ferric uptake transcriptional regulator